MVIEEGALFNFWTGGPAWLEQRPDDKWFMPEEGEEGLIGIIDTDKVLGITGEITSGAEVVVEPKKIPDIDHQIWKIHKVRIQDDHGYKGPFFKIQNVKSGLYATVTEDMDKVILQGNHLFLC